MADAPLPRIGGGVDLSALAARAKAAKQAESPGTSSTLVVTGENLQSVVEQDSTQYPIVLAVLDMQAADAASLVSVLTGTEQAKQGQIKIATLDARAYPEVVQALQVPQLPIVIAVIGGRLLPLFTGLPQPEAVQQAFGQVLQAAQQAGITGTAPQASNAQGSAEVPVVTYTPTQQRGYTAMEAGDFTEAAAAFAQAVEENPHDAASEQALAQAKLLGRAAHPDEDPVLSAADDAMRDGSNIDEAFAQLLGKIRTTFGDERKPYQARLVEYFTLLGPDDPRVVPARRELAQLLY